MATFFSAALDVEIQGMLANDEASFGSDGGLSLFDFSVEKLFDTTTVEADHMIMMIAGFELENGLARLEKMPFEQAGLFELGQDAINRCQANVNVFGQQ